MYEYWVDVVGISEQFQTDLRRRIPWRKARQTARGAVPSAQVTTSEAIATTLCAMLRKHRNHPMPDRGQAAVALSSACQPRVEVAEPGIRLGG